MGEAPERIWAKRVSITIVCDGEWWCPHDDCFDELPDGATEYVRSDLHAALAAERDALWERVKRWEPGADPEKVGTGSIGNNG